MSTTLFSPTQVNRTTNASENETRTRIFRRVGERSATATPAATESETAKLVRRMLGRSSETTATPTPSATMTVDSSSSETASNTMGGDESELTEVLLNLRRSETRLEQIKRLLVAQRGLVVQALRAAADLSARVNRGEEEQQQESGMSEQQEKSETKSERKSEKQCPMCEANFDVDVDEEVFESHVVEHFVFEEADTIKYVSDMHNNEAQQEAEDETDYATRER